MRRIFPATMLVVIAQTAPAQARLAKPVIDTVNHHIVRVMNPGPTQWAGTNGWKLVLERTIAPPEGSTAILAQPFSLAVDRSGQVYETDWKVDGIQVFAADGRYQRTIGRKGDGPGEFQNPVALDIRGDTLLTYASNQSRVSLRRTDGTLFREWRVDFCCGGFPQLMANGTTVIRVITRINGVDHDAAIRWRPNGTLLDSVALGPQPPVHGWHNASGGVYPIPFSTYQIGTFNSRGWYVNGNSAHYALAIAHNGTDTARLIELPGTRAPIPATRLDSVFAGYAKVPALALVVKRSDIPTVQPYFTGLHVDEQDNVWIERPRGDGYIGSFDVIDGEGRLRGTVAAPAGNPRLIVFRNGRMYCIVENDDGVPVIQVYRVDKGAH